MSDARNLRYNAGNLPTSNENSLDLVFGALSDPTRRHMLEAIMRDGTSSVPALTAELPITRQAVAKHLATLDQAGLIERDRTTGREVHYRLRPRALQPASTWLAEADAAWAGRLGRLKQTLERGSAKN
jgi:DNA-binding MarR family transcriptional regulator